MFHKVAEVHGPVHEKPLRKSEIGFRRKRMSIDVGQRSFSFDGAHVWNALSEGGVTEDQPPSSLNFFSNLPPL